MTILSRPEPIILNSVQKEKYKKSKKYFYTNWNSYFFFYQHFSFLFKKKISHFFQESDYFLEIREKETHIFKYKVAQAIANGDYSVNGLCHYTFLIEGQYHTYGIVEIDQKIFETARYLKRNKESDIELNNVVSLFK